MPGLRSQWRKYQLVASTSLRNRWTYPADVFGLVFSYGLFVFVFSRLWSAAYSDKATLAGYTQHELTWYFIIAELVLFGMGNGTFSKLSTDIKTGQVAYTLARPWSLTLTALSENLACALGMMVPFALVGCVIGSLNAGVWVPVAVGQAALLLLSLLLSLILLFLCQFVLSMTAFWVEENNAFLWIHQKFALVLGTFLPLEFFPEAWRPWIALTPYGWLCYPPSRMAVVWRPDEAWGLVGGQLVWVAVLAAAAVAVSRVGRRRTVVQGG